AMSRGLGRGAAQRHIPSAWRTDDAPDSPTATIRRSAAAVSSHAPGRRSDLTTGAHQLFTVAWLPVRTSWGTLAQQGPSGGQHPEAQGIGLGVAMRPHGTAVPAGRPGFPGTGGGANALLTTAGGDMPRFSTGPQPVVSVRDTQGHKAPEFLSSS